MARELDRHAVDAEFARMLRDREIQTLFQPIVHLSSGAVVGYEALVRGGENSVLPSADSLIAAANRTGRLAEFDWAARASACRAAAAAGLDVDNLLLLNIEPIALDSDCPEDLWPDIESAFQTYRVVLEVTERSLDRDPATLLDGVERVRPRVEGIGLDDVGSQPATVAMLALVAPDVIKIDRTIVQAAADEDVARVVVAVHEQAQRTGAAVLAEGVETVEHRYHGLTQGAQIGQGYVFGGPGPLPTSTGPLQRRAQIRRASPMVISTPFEALAGEADATASDDVMLALTSQHAAYAEAAEPALYVSLLPGPPQWHATDMQRLATMAQSGTFAAVLGPGVPSEPGQGVRGTGSRRERLPQDQWAAVAVGPAGSSAILARRVPDGEGTWMYGITNSPTRVIAAARSLIRLVGPPEPHFRYEI